MFKQRFLQLRTILRLGLLNVTRVWIYRLSVRSGLLKKRLPRGNAYAGPLFHANFAPQIDSFEVLPDKSVVKAAEGLLKGKVCYFSFHVFEVGSPPDWFQNPFNNQRCAEPGLHWSDIGDFESGIGDIKTIWEVARFDWALVFARAFRQTGDFRFFDTLNNWISDWIQKNPLNTGPNWKCGQETSIRMLQVLLAAHLLRQDTNPADTLLRFIAEHCSRIEPTLHYAMAQNNNHGTSEASALFIGGAWLEKYSQDIKLRRKGAGWKNAGRKWLENRLKKLVGEDGSFSQYSMNYHRVVLDTLNIVEFWRRKLTLEKFSPLFYARSRAAVSWLFQMVDHSNGDAPNLGSNDGARLFVLSSTPYRDYRPSVQVGSVLFLGKKAYKEGEWDEPLVWLDLSGGEFYESGLSKKNLQFSNGGYVVFSGGEGIWGLLRYPNFSFRPSHADAFHFDLWCRGENILRDSGSYSYNAEEPWRSYFASTRAHNTIQFDARDQMPSISRFLRAAWLKMDDVGKLHCEKNQISWSGSYRDSFGCWHRRTVICEGDLWKVVDEISGFKSSAVLRWRLKPCDWEISDSTCVGPFGSLKVTSDVPIKRFELGEGWESRYYLEKSRIPVLEIEVGSDKAVFTSEICLTN